MKHYLQLELGQGAGHVVAEVEELEGAEEVERAARAGRLLEKAGQSLQAALAKARPIAAAVLAQVRDLSSGVNEVHVEFGLKLHGEMGVVIASGGSEANFKVALRWRPAQPQAGATS